MSDYAGWKFVLKINGKDVYYHKGRDSYAIERDHSYLGGLMQREQDIFDHMLKYEEYDDPYPVEPDYRESPVGPGVSHVLGEVW